MDREIIGLTAGIVSGRIRNNPIDRNQLPGLIREVNRALTSTQHVASEPAVVGSSVAVKDSIFPDRIVCLDCGKSFKMLKRHIATDHQMTPDQYRAKWGLPRSYRLVAPDYATTRSKLALASGLGRKGSARAEKTRPAAKKLRSSARELRL